MADVKLRIDVGAETAAANAALAEVGAAAERVSEAVGDLHVDADVSEANAALAEVGAAAERVSESLGGTEGAAEGAEDALAEVGDSAEAAAGGANAANAALARLNSATSRMSGTMRGFTERIREASSAMRERLAKSAASLASSLGSAGFTAAKVGLGAVTAAFGAATAACVKLGAAQEQTRLKFGVLLGDAAKGNKLFGQLKEFANATPFSTNEVVKAGQTLLSFGVAAGDVQDTLLKVGNAAAATGVNVAEMAAIYGKAMVKGKVEAETLNQMSERGVPIIKALARQMGIAEKEVYKLTSQGKIGANDLRKAFFSLSEAGGAYSGMMEKQSRTVGGLWSTLSGKITDVAATLGEQFMPVIQAALDKAVALADALGKMASGGDLAAGLSKTIGEVTQKMAGAAKFIANLALVIRMVFKMVVDQLGGTIDVCVGKVMSTIGSAMVVVEKMMKGIVWAYNKVRAALDQEPIEVEFDIGRQGQALKEAGEQQAKEGRDRQIIRGLGGANDAFRDSLLSGKGLGDAAGEWLDTLTGGFKKAWGYVDEALGASSTVETAVDRTASAVKGWTDKFAKDVKANAKKRKDDADKATLEKAAPEQAAPAIRDIVADRGLARQVDSLATIGLYNFSRSAEDNLDLRRNNLLEAIRNGIDRMASQGQGGQVAAMPALGSV